MSGISRRSASMYFSHSQLVNQHKLDDMYKEYRQAFDSNPLCFQSLQNVMRLINDITDEYSCPHERKFNKYVDVDILLRDLVSYSLPTRPW